MAQGLLGDYLSDDPNQAAAQKAGLLNFGAQLLAARTPNFGQSLGQGLIGGSQAYQSVLQDQQKQAQQAAQAKYQGLQGQVLQQQLDQPAQIASVIRNAGGGQPMPAGLPPQQSLSIAPPTTAQPAMVSPDSVVRVPQSQPDWLPQGPTAQPQSSPVNAPAPVAPQSIYQKYMQIGDALAAQGFTDNANKYYDLANKLSPKLKEQKQLRDANGKVVTANVFEDGTTKTVDGYTPAEKLSFQNTGGATVGLDPYTGLPINTIRNSQSPDNASTVAATIRGQNVVDARARDTAILGSVPSGYRRNPDGSLSYVVGGPADPNTPKSKNNLTEQQGKATGFAARMQDANKVISQYDGKVSPSAVAAVGGVAPSWLPGGSAVDAATNYAVGKLDPTAQLYQQAQENWLTANLRLESGAVIGDNEKAAEIKKWFPQPGDSPARIQQKAAARGVAERGMIVQAGPGAQSINSILTATPANAPRVGTIKGGYTYKGGDPADQNNWVQK